jgi:dTDP-4-amino-4,6-dideoxygalactose transaminase
MSVASPPVLQKHADVPVLRPLMPSAETLLPYLRRIDANRVYSNHGPLVREFEGRIARMLALPASGVATASSGTAALTAAILAVAGRATPNRPYALIPAYTYVATAMAAEQVGYQPYLADIDTTSWMLDPMRLADHPSLAQLGVVIPVAPFGRPVPQAQWLDFQARTGVPVVIDGAACISEIVEQPALYIGKIPLAISFHATKGLSTGEGGGVVSTDTDRVLHAMRALNFGCYGSREAQSMGMNGKMSEYHAAVGLAELDGWARKRLAFQSVAEGYRRAAAEHRFAGRFFVTPEIGMPYALYRCRNLIEAKHMQQALKDAGVGWRLWYGTGLHHHAYFVDAPRDQLGATAQVAPTLIGLPMAVDLTPAQIAHVIAVLAEAAQRCD